jgi:3-phenylpropionate/trans-cinnamate dioxygenase ferredoxin reductase component
MAVVIVGAGQAGFQAAASLRTGRYEEPITLIGDEPHLPYQRPPLSKGFLLGKQTIESTTLRPEAFYTTQRIDCILDDRVTQIDRATRHVLLASGVQVAFDHLILATGARVRTLAFPDVHYLRNREDAVEINDNLDQAETVAVIGGGFIGLEVASAARSLGKSVTVFELQPRLMPRCVSPIVSDFYRELHTTNGVNIVLGAPAAIPDADLILAGVGVLPNQELARDAGLPVANGIVVDQYLKTADPNIFAIGDCAEHPNPFAGTRTRLESVQNAVDQAKCAAANILGQNVPYRVVPWFWTDQYDVMLQMAGLSGGADREVLRGDRASKRFSVFYFKDSHLIAVDSINRPADHMAGRKLLASGAQLTPDQAADENFDLKSLLIS